MIIGVARTSPATTCRRGVRADRNPLQQCEFKSETSDSGLLEFDHRFICALHGWSESSPRRVQWLRDLAVWTTPNRGCENLDDGLRPPRHRLFRRYSTTKSESLTELKLIL